MGVTINLSLSSKKRSKNSPKNAAAAAWHATGRTFLKKIPFQRKIPRLFLREHRVEKSTPLASPHATLTKSLSRASLTSSASFRLQRPSNLQPCVVSTFSSFALLSTCLGVNHLVVGRARTRRGFAGKTSFEFFLVWQLILCCVLGVHWFGLLDND